MCRLTLQLQQMSNDVPGDAILIQPKQIGCQDRPDYAMATGIIRRVNTPQGGKWIFSNLLTTDSMAYSCSNTHNDLADAVIHAKYQYGEKLLDHDFVTVQYRDSNFPQHLIPN